MNISYRVRELSQLVIIVLTINRLQIVLKQNRKLQKLTCTDENGHAVDILGSTKTCLECDALRCHQDKLTGDSSRVGFMCKIRGGLFDCIKIEKLTILSATIIHCQQTMLHAYSPYRPALIQIKERIAHRASNRFR